MMQERQHPGSLGTSEAWMRRVTVKGMELFAWLHSVADLRGNKMSPSGLQAPPMHPVKLGKAQILLVNSPSIPFLIDVG